MKPRAIVALLLPFVACGIQMLLWEGWIKPFVWFLFFPVAFFSAWLGGLRVGLAATGISALLVWYVFMAPRYSFSLADPAAGFSIAVFTIMGGLFAWFHDKLQRALQRSEDRLAATFEQAAVGIALVAPDGHWLRVNRKLCAIVGYTPSELMDKTFQDITHPDDIDADVAQVKRMLEREIDNYALEKRYRRKDGSLVWINLTVAMIWKLDGTPDCFISVIEDIAARKAAEAALQASEQRFRELSESANSAILRWDKDGRVTYINEYAQGFFGWPEREIIGRPVGLLLPEKDAAGPDLTGLVAAIAAHPERFVRNINENVCRDGRRVWMAWTNSAMRDKSGALVEILCHGVDITERKRMEEQLQRRNEELERFDRASVGRELQMIELKRQVNALAKELGRAPPHDLGFVAQAESGKEGR